MPLSDYEQAFQDAAHDWNVDPTLLKAMAATESAGKPGAVSRKGAGGLMQIMPDTQKSLGITDPNDPVQSIWGAAKYLNQALSAEKTPEDALRYYHGGPGWRNSYGPESQAYVPTIAAKYKAMTTPATPSAPAAPNDPFTAALNAASNPTAAPAAPNDPFSQAVQAAQKASTPAAPTPVEPTPMSPNEYGVTDDPQQFNKQTPGLSINLPKTADEARAMVAPAPGYAPMNVLPFDYPVGPDGKDDPTRSPKFDLLAPFRGPASSLIHLLDSQNQLADQPIGANLPPEDAATLAGLVAGGALGRSPASGTGAAIADTAAYGAPQNALYAANRAPNPLSAPAPVAVNPLNTMTIRAADPAAGTGAAPAVPQSVGAAASRDMSPASAIDMTPKQVQAYRSTAEGQKLLEPQQPGVVDPNIYVPGVTPNTAEIEQQVNTSRELKTLNTTAPDVSQEAKEIAAENNDKRSRFFSGIAGSKVDVENAIAARSAQAEKDLGAAFGNKKPTDAQPVVDAIQNILSSPRDSENTAVQQYVSPLLDRLKNSDGTLKSDPEQLYGLREDISRMQSKAAKAETPTLDHVDGQLQSIKSALDGVIENGAPGYQEYLANYSSASRPIDTMQALQEFENKLYDTQSRMGYAKVQSMMRQIVDSRAAPGLNQFKSIPDDTMQQLWNLRDDLRRSASAKELASASGSDTTQNAWDIARQVGNVGGNMLAHGAANAISPGWGSVALSTAKNALSPVFSARAAAKRTARGMKMLHPDPSMLRNPLHD